MKSMTGYGRCVWEDGTTHIEAEIRCVNGRYFSLASKLPQELFAYESEIKQIIAQRVSRGSVSLTVSYEDTAVQHSHIDTDLLCSHYRHLKAIAESLYLPPPSLDTLLQLPGVVDTPLKAALPDTGWQRVSDAIRRALHDMNAMQECEGQKLQQEIIGYWQQLETSLGEIARLAPNIVAGYRERLKKRLRELSQEDGFHYTDADILREVALFTDRVDISEEIARSKSHLAQMKELLAKQEPAGKTMEFLLQEIARESNTITAKANDAECSRCVVTIKTLVEKIREQIQNVE